jgi:predicted HicB family RNase H-like nuclease
MTYKGYEGIAEFDEEARIFSGEVIGLKDVITFQGESVDELEQAFHDSVDDYLEWCEADGETPDKPYSGNVLLRFNPELHRKIAAAARKKKVSINKFMEKAAEDELLQG